MARKRKRGGRKKKKSGSIVALIVVALLVFVGVYVGHHLYQRYQQQQIIDRRNNARKLFIKQVAPEAQAMQNRYHVLSSITIAQAILESDWGSSKLAAQYHNLFGIKGTGPNSKELATKEFVDDKWIVIKGRFKVYDSWDDSIKDHTQLMLNGTDTNKENYSLVTSATDYKTAAHALQQCGYATDPDYAKKLIDVIETYHLDEYDK